MKGIDQKLADRVAVSFMPRCKLLVAVPSRRIISNMDPSSCTR